MRQPENDHTKMFGNDGPVGNDAEIIVYYEQQWTSGASVTHTVLVLQRRAGNV